VILGAVKPSETERPGKERGGGEVRGTWMDPYITEVFTQTG